MLTPSPLVRAFAVLVACAAVLASCGSGSPASSAMLDAEVVVSGLEGPTQLAVAPDGSYYIAQLAGGENEATGQVLHIEPSDPVESRTVVLDGLDKPTGVALFAGDLWVMERRRLIRADLDGSNARVVVDGMAYNGRSQGSLTVDGNRLLFDTSGRLSQRTEAPIDPESSSGVLWAVTADGEVSAVAHGFKHAYAQTRGPDGVLWTTELADGTYDGRVAVDEIVAVVEGADHGWPRCVGDNRAVVEFGGSEQTCKSVPVSLAVFDSGATPTGLAVAPWDPAQLLVALWVTGEVVEVRLDAETAPVSAVSVYSSAGRPQHLHVDGDRVLLVDHGAGRVLALRPG